MYAVIQTGGKQYRVAAGDTIHVEKLDGEVGGLVQIDKVLMVGSDDAVKVGRPTVDGASVVGEILAQERGKKIVIFKHKRRKGYRRKQGHRQYLTTLRIKEIKGD